MFKIDDIIKYLIDNKDKLSEDDLSRLEKALMSLYNRPSYFFQDSPESLELDKLSGFDKLKQPNLGKFGDYEVSNLIGLLGLGQPNLGKFGDYEVSNLIGLLGLGQPNLGKFGDYQVSDLIELLSRNTEKLSDKEDKSAKNRDEVEEVKEAQPDARGLLVIIDMENSSKSISSNKKLSPEERNRIFHIFINFLHNVFSKFRNVVMGVEDGMKFFVEKDSGEKNKFLPSLKELPQRWENFCGERSEVNELMKKGNIQKGNINSPKLRIAVSHGDPQKILLSNHNYYYDYRLATVYGLCSDKNLYHKHQSRLLCFEETVKVASTWGFWKEENFIYVGEYHSKKTEERLRICKPQ